jgi:hypothetical protein
MNMSHQTPHPQNQQRLSYHARWRRLGLTLDGLRTTVHSVTHSTPSPQRVEVQVRSTVSCHPTASTSSTTSKKKQRAGKGEEGTPLLEVITTYVIYGSGDLRVRLAVASLYGPKQRQTPLHLPRMGLALSLPKSLSEASWLGLGPHECYADRKAGAWLGVHSAGVEEMYTPYVVPSACSCVYCCCWVC